MGNWKRKPRRNYNYEYPRPPSDPGLWQGSVPPWEKRFCTSSGVPWGKVLNSKRYIHYNVDVLNWNDSAGEEAFHNAKRRFWEEINGIPCSIPLPEPDIYIDDIDWNPYIDPELIRNLDKEFFAPDEIEEYCKLEDSSQNTNGPLSGCTAEGYDRNPAIGDNPWELNMQKTLKDREWAWDTWGGCKNELSNFDKTNSQVLSSSVEGHYRKPDSGDCPWEYWNMHGVLKGEAQAWNQWGGNINESRNLNGDDDCLKHSCTWASGAVRDASGGHCEGNSWRMWNEGSEHINQFSNLDGGVDDWNRSWNQANEARRGKAHGGWSQGWNYQNKSRNLNTADNPWKRGFHGAESMGFKGGDLGNSTWGGNQTEKDGSDSRDKSQCWNQWENGNNEPKRLESRKGSGGWGVWNGGENGNNEPKRLQSRKGSGGWGVWNGGENGNNEPKRLKSRKGSGGWGVWNGGENGNNEPKRLESRKGCGGWGVWNGGENGNNEPKRLESRKGSGGWGVCNGGCQKREGSRENTSSYKCSRVQGDGYQTGHWGRKGKAKKRFDFFSGVDNNG